MSGRTEAAEEIKRVIAFYEVNGWDWSSIVCFLSMQQNGLWPPPPTRRHLGRSCKLKSN